MENITQFCWQYSSSFQQWKNFENRLRFEKVIAKKFGGFLFWNTVQKETWMSTGAVRVARGSPPPNALSSPIQNFPGDVRIHTRTYLVKAVERAGLKSCFTALSCPLRWAPARVFRIIAWRVTMSAVLTSFTVTSANGTFTVSSCDVQYTPS